MSPASPSRVSSSAPTVTPFPLYLLTLGSLESLSLHSINLTENISTMASRCSRQLAVLDLVGNGLRSTVADVFNLAAACSGLRSLNLSGNSVGKPPAGKNPFGSGGFSLEVLDLSYNKISGEADLRWLLSSLGLLWQLDLSGNHLTGGILMMSTCSDLQHLDLLANELVGMKGGGSSACAGV